ARHGRQRVCLEAARARPLAGQLDEPILIVLAPPGGATMDQMRDLLSGGGMFALYFLLSTIFLPVFIFLYSLVTPYRELTLIRAGNKPAALSLGGAILGFVIPVGKVVAQSASIGEMIAWAAIAFAAQVLAYLVASLLLPHLRRTIADDQLASGILLAA